uniref:Uncharacterized protein n=1 Tax=Arion vulgaris TaxID=1028688 RepID=A0A0B7ARK8_9EUPU
MTPSWSSLIHAPSFPKRPCYSCSQACEESKNENSLVGALTTRSEDARPGRDKRARGWDLGVTITPDCQH